MEMADKIVVLNDGKVDQIGTRESKYWPFTFKYILFILNFSLMEFHL